MIENTKSFFRIKKIRYDVIDLEVPNVELFVGHEDRVDNFVLADNEPIVTFDVTRLVTFEPKVLYTLSVTLEIKVLFDSKDEIDLESIKQNAKNIVESTSGLSSLVNLIANITSGQGNPPVITPPNLDYEYKM